MVLRTFVGCLDEVSSFVLFAVGLCPDGLCIPGTFYEFGTPEYNQYITPDIRTPGSRAVIVIDVHKVGTVRPSKDISQNDCSQTTEIVLWLGRSSL